MWRGWLAIDRVDGASLRGLITEIIAIAKQRISVGGQANAPGTIDIARTRLTHQRSTRADPRPPTPNVGVVVLALAENVAQPGPTKVGGHVAIGIGRTRSPRPGRMWNCPNKAEG